MLKMWHKSHRRSDVVLNDPPTRHTLNHHALYFYMVCDGGDRKDAKIMRISAEQAEKCFELLTNYKDYGDSVSTEVYRKSCKLIKEIEAANKPMEIEYCSIHNSTRTGQFICCDFAVGRLDLDPKSCDIRTFVEKP